MQIYDRGPYHIETSPLICNVNQWTGFYITQTSIKKELIGIMFLIVLQKAPLTRFNTLHYCTTENVVETKNFLTFSGRIKMKVWAKMG